MAARDTPVMRQHADAKREYPEAIVFFRLGDFYEMFGEDAIVAAGALDLVLTSRNKGQVRRAPSRRARLHHALARSRPPSCAMRAAGRSGKMPRSGSQTGRQSHYARVGDGG